MLPINFIRQEKERVARSLQKRNFKNIDILDSLIALDDQRKQTQTQLDILLAEANNLAKLNGVLKKENKLDELEANKLKATQLREQASTVEAQLKITQEELNTLSLQLPNCLNERVPAGKDAEDNEVYKAWDAPMPVLHEGALPHWELAKKIQPF